MIETHSSFLNPYSHSGLRMFDSVVVSSAYHQCIRLEAPNKRASTASVSLCECVWIFLEWVHLWQKVFVWDA